MMTSFLGAIFERTKANDYEVNLAYFPLESDGSML